MDQAKSLFSNPNLPDQKRRFSRPVTGHLHYLPGPEYQPGYTLVEYLFRRKAMEQPPPRNDQYKTLMHVLAHWEIGIGNATSGNFAGLNRHVLPTEIVLLPLSPNSNGTIEKRSKKIIPGCL
jgi:hypothetical protein